MCIACLSGCNVPVNNNQEFDTALAKVTRAGTVYAPFGSQTIGATYYGETGTLYIDGDTINPAGSQTAVNGVTASSNSTAYSSTLANWPTNYIADGMYMPAYWTVLFTPSMPCYDPTTSPTATPPYPTLPSTQSNVDELIPGVGSGFSWSSEFEFSFGTSAPAPLPIPLTCYINTPANPEISPTGVSPRFVLDDEIPASVQVAAFAQINAAPVYTFLHLFSSDLQQFTTQVASTVAPDGMSAVFSYPTAQNGSALPAGAYIGTITTDIPGQPETTNAMEPLVIGHDDTSFPGAFGIAVVDPKVTSTSTIFLPEGSRPCGREVTSSGASGGTPLPLVTLLTQGALAVGNSSNTIPVGSNPTVVIPFNDQGKTVSDTIPGCTGARIVSTYTGAQSALVVNTGSNSVSIVNIGYASYPAGTVAVGNQPVAAVINSAETMAYIANYTDGTVSEVNLSTLAVTRTISVMACPTSLSFDASGNLWIGGQGYVDEVSLSNWVVASSTPVDGTINEMAYAPTQNAMVQVLLQNGTVGSPVSGGTFANAVLYSSPQSSYSTVNVMGVANLSSSGPTIAAASNAAYTQSAVAQYLAFPAQTAFVPPTLSSSSGDIVAVANGNSFTVTWLPTGESLISGTLPYAIRGVAVGQSSIYFTMPESNSVVSLPIDF